MRLSNCIALVTGATRGGGRGIALGLAEQGATVYVTGRSSHKHPHPSYPGTVEEVAEAVTAAGGNGIGLQVDHSQRPEVRALVDRIVRDQGRIDLLVNNAWGAHDSSDQRTLPFWEEDVELCWQLMFERGARLSMLTAAEVVPKMLGQGRGLIVQTSAWDHDVYTGIFYYDIAKATLNRLAFAMAQELKSSGITSVALAPGWMRTELVLRHFQASPENWQDVPDLARTESPLYLGRAVAALAGDPQIHEKTGQLLYVGELARHYGFTDCDGRQPEVFRLS